MPTPDQIDWKILDTLKENSRLSTSKISKKTGIPITTVFNRMKKLEKEKVIKNYTINLDQKKLGKSILAYILIDYNRTTETPGGLTKKILSIPGVEHAGFVTGRVDAIIMVRADNIDFLNNKVIDKIRQIPGILRSETFVVLEEVK